MQISLTKKLSDVMGVKPNAPSERVNQLFCWTANWTNTFEGRKEDMVVLVNKATRFTVAIYGIKRKQFKDINKTIIVAIKNTFLELNFSEEIIDEYFKLAGEIEYSSNNDRQLTTWVNSQGRDAAIFMGRKANKAFRDIKYDDTIGVEISWRSVNYSKNYNDSYIPAEKIIEALKELSKKHIYNYRAFEILITLNLQIYNAKRRLIVPANIKMENLHYLIQEVYCWRNYHLYEFEVFDKDKQLPIKTLTPSEESLAYNEKAEIIDCQRLSDYLPKFDKIIYTYDMGDDWQHEINLIKTIDNHNLESPYLLEAVGQAPPEDVGGVEGFIKFWEIMQKPKHPDHESNKAWAGFWSMELPDWHKRPRVIRR